jgi:hypothetical protein
VERDVPCYVSAITRERTPKDLTPKVMDNSNAPPALPRRDAPPLEFVS